MPSKYDFDAIVSRRSTQSVKWDFTSDEKMIPLWVADMDFKAAPPIIAALQKRLGHGVFGYSEPSSSYYEAIVKWFEGRHCLKLRPGWILPVTGVVAALTAIIKALAQSGDKVLFQTPVYNCFFSSVLNNGCAIQSNALIRKNGCYSIDFEDLARKAADPKVRLMILCNPHNPVGRVWSKAELEKIGRLCLDNKVFVIADEIHCELIRPGFTYTPFASICEDFLLNSVTCTSPSKAFNLAGLQCANIFAADKGVRSKIEKALHENEVSMIGPFGIDALTAAYNQCGDWLDQLNIYLNENYLMLKDFFQTHLPQFPVTPLEGTYLAWADCSILGKTSQEISDLLLKEGVRINPGSIYGKEGEGFIRINFACPKGTLKEGLLRIKSALLNALKGK